MIFICIECYEPFEVKDEAIVQAMINKHLETGCCCTCPNCQAEKEASCETE